MAVTPRVSDPRQRLPGFLALLLIPLLLWPTLALPLERDEAEYALAARLWSEGGTPYVDTFFQKPPGILLVYRALLAFGDSPAVLHAGAAVAYMVTGLIVLSIARRLFGVERAAVVAVVAFAMLITIPAFQATAANTEVFMVLAVAASAWLVLRARDGRQELAAVGGLAFGLACFTKQPAVMHAPWLLLLVPTWRGRAWFAISAAAPFVVALAAFALAGALPDFLDAVLLHNLEYVGDSSLEKRYLTSIGWTWPLPRSATAILPLAVLALLLSGTRGPALIVGGWLLTGAMGAALGDVFRGHYAIQLFPAVALAAGAAASRARRLAWAVAAAMTFVWWVAEGVPFGKSVEQHLTERYTSPYFLIPPIAADWLRPRATSLYVFGSEPDLYFRTGLRPPTRYVIQNPLFGGYPSSRRRQEEVWAAVGTPSHIVTAHPRWVVPMFPESDAWLAERLDERLAAGYDTVGFVPIGAARVREPAAMQGAGDWIGLIIHQRRTSTP